MMMKIADAWRTIDAKVEFAGASESFAEGAADTAIEAAQRALGVELPPEFVASYRVHDGQQTGVEFLFGPYRLWCLEEVVENHRALLASGCDSGEQLVGFADNGGNSTVAIRLAEGEDYGAVIELMEDGEEPLADSMRAFLSSLAERLETGELLWSTDAGGFETLADREEAEKYAAQQAAWETARAGPTAASIRELPPGTETELTGTRYGAVERDIVRFATFDGRVKLRGSLKGAGFNQPIRVRIRVGPRPKFGLGSPVYEILSWEPIEPE